jgi:hypothetical protein
MTKEEQAERSKRVQATGSLDPTITVMLKGVEYTLEYNNSAVKGIKDDLSLGFNLLDGFDSGVLSDPIKITKMLLWGMVSNHPDVTEQFIDERLALKHWPYYMDRIMAAITPFMPDFTDLEPSSEQVIRVKEPSDPKMPTPAGSDTGHLEEDSASVK